MNEYYKDLIAAIVEQIKPNDNEEITGQIMQNVLLAIVRHLGDGHVYGGIATPTTVRENSPQGAVFYIATERGMYESFDDITVTDNDGEIVVLSYDPHLDVWSKASFSITLSAGAVGTAQLADGAVTSDKLASQSVTQGKIASNAVVTGKLAGKAVTVPKLGDDVWKQVDAIIDPVKATADAAKQAVNEMQTEVDKKVSITAQTLTTAQKEQTLANIGISTVFLDTSELNSVLPDDVAAKVEAAQLLVVSGSVYGTVILSRAYISNGLIDFRAVFDNRTVYYIRYTTETKRITSLATTAIVDPNKVSFASAQDLTAEQQTQARTNIDAMAATPSGDPMHYMYEEIGATWNAATGYWEMDYLTDITTQQMRLIYLWRNPSTVPTTNGRHGVPNTVRAIVNMNANRAQGIAGYMFSNCTGAELITFRNEGITLSNTASAAIFMFYRCLALQVISGRIDLHLITTDNYFNSMFGGCSALREVRLYQLAASGLDLSATSVLSAASVRYLVENAINTTPITVYVSPAMHMLLADSEDDWDGILDAATAQQITFEVPAPTVALSDEVEKEITE